MVIRSLLSNEKRRLDVKTDDRKMDKNCGCATGAGCRCNPCTCKNCNC